MTRYILFPADDEGDVKYTQLPKNLVSNDIYEGIKQRVKDRIKLKAILKQLAKNGISESENGGIMLGDDQFSNINLRSALVDTCNNVFYEKYEQFYELLRKLEINI